MACYRDSFTFFTFAIRKERSFQGTVQVGAEENVTASRKQLHNEDAHNLQTYSSSNIINMMHGGDGSGM
jgi:hypothetical protein